MASALTQGQIDTIKKTIAPYAQGITQVGVFGSRATGKAKANSDIDLVVYGSITEATIRRLYTLFTESSLPVKVDIVGYNLVAYPPLKRHIDGNVKILFTQRDF